MSREDQQAETNQLESDQDRYHFKGKVGFVPPFLSFIQTLNQVSEDEQNPMV